jgi:bacterioferritin-associated ferredoxin
MIVCLCHGVRDRDLDAAISSGAGTVEEIGRACGAGTGCGTCIPEVEDRLARSGACGDCPTGDAPPTLATIRAQRSRL